MICTLEGYTLTQTFHVRPSANRYSWIICSTISSWSNNTVLWVHSIKELKIYRNGNSVNFVSYADIAKTFEELFASTWNGIAVNVWYVSCTPVVLHAGLNDQLRRMLIRKWDDGKRRNPKAVTTFPKHKNLVTDLLYIYNNA